MTNTNEISECLTRADDIAFQTANNGIPIIGREELSQTVEITVINFNAFARLAVGIVSLTGCTVTIDKNS
jgi:hypothetical protein